MTTETIVATLTVVQTATGVSLRASIRERHDDSLPGRLIRVAHDAANSTLAGWIGVEAAEARVEWEDEQ
jgi:hypothetical protein